MALLELKKVSKYFGGLAAVSDLDIDVEEGEIRGIIGPNGAGKTTLFNVISGVYRPTTGRIIYEGKEVSNLKPSEIAERGLVRTFQLTTLFPDFSVLRNVTVARFLHTKTGVFRTIFGGEHLKEKESEKKALEIIDFLGLSHLKDELALNLPHGHQRALGVAIALAAEPKLIMLDEPVTGMTPTEKQTMMDIIKKIREQGVTVLVVEHDMKTVMGICDKITVLSFGKKLAEGLPKEIRENKEVIEAYLGAEEIAA